MRRRARGLGGWIALAAAGLGVAAAMGAVPAPPAPADPAAPAQVTQVARSLYLQNCASCHGAEGEGAALGPSLVGVGAASADFYLRTGRMPLGAPGQQAVRREPIFDDEQIRLLVEYVASFGDGPAIPQVSDGGDVREGWRLYTANCAACHAATGSGNAVGGGNYAVGLGRADPRTIAEAMLIGPGAMPRFEYDDEQRDAVVAYVTFLQSAPTPGGLPIGGFGPVAEGFVAVAVGLVLLVLVAMFVGRRTHRGEPGGPLVEPVPDGPGAAPPPAGETRP